jgi:hypothetical protein
MPTVIVQSRTFLDKKDGSYALLLLKRFLRLDVLGGVWCRGLLLTNRGVDAPLPGLDLGLLTNRRGEGCEDTGAD